MKKTFTRILSLMLVVIMAAMLMLPAYADGAYDFAADGAYAGIVTGSDFQEKEAIAYSRYYNILSGLKEDGMETPVSMLSGGDYSKMLPDAADPGVKLIREYTLELYPDMKEEDIVLIQGNHDLVSAGFTRTGWYDMGAYLLYAINEDAFPWKQGFRPDGALVVSNLAKNVEAELNKLIENGDTRPVVILTHVPLHYSNRDNGLDNKYSSVLFNVLNEAGKKLDIVFLFGHNHSDQYDDYIGGAVNFMAPGEKILIPDASKVLQNAYTEETLTFTYTNCGYVGYSKSSAEAPSTTALTLGVIRIAEDRLIFLKYREKGCFRQNEVERKNPGHALSASEGGRIISARIWEFVKNILNLFPFITTLFHSLSNLL